MSDDESGHHDRLPHGRHGLTPEFVAQRQRARILDAVIGEVADHGYEATTIARIVARAGLSRQTFYQQFTNQAEAYEVALEESLGLRMRRSFELLAAPGPPLDRTRDVLTEFLRALADRPDAARCFILEGGSNPREAIRQGAQARADFARAMSVRFGVEATFPFEAYLAMVTTLTEAKVALGHFDELPGLVDPLIGGLRALLAGG